MKVWVAKLVMSSANPTCEVLRIIGTHQWSYIRRVVFLKEEFSFISLSNEPTIMFALESGSSYKTTGKNAGLFMVKSTANTPVHDYEEERELVTVDLP